MGDGYSKKELEKLTLIYKKRKRISLFIFLVFLIIELTLYVLFARTEEIIFLIVLLTLSPVLLSFLIIIIFINPNKIATRKLVKKKKVVLKNKLKELENKIRTNTSILSKINREIKYVNKKQIIKSKFNQLKEGIKLGTKITVSEKKKENKIKKESKKKNINVDRIGIERQMAREIQKKESYFTIPKILEELDRDSSHSPDEKSEIFDEIKRWVSQDPLVKKIGENDGINRYIFI